MTPRTVVVSGNGTNSVIFTIPPLVEFTPESVVASVDAGSAGNTIAELQIADQSGVVIAAKRQSTPIPAGDTGLATWALRLDTEAVAAAGGYVFVAEGNSFDPQSFAVPQDARHLVLFVHTFAASLALTFNHDNGNNYRTIEDSLQDNSGVLTDVPAISARVNGIALDQVASATSYTRAVVTIPYYRRVIRHVFETIDRSVEAEIWVHDNNPVGGYDLYSHTKVAGFWNDPAPTSAGAHPITSIQVRPTTGGPGVISLYKIV